MALPWVRPWADLAQKSIQVCGVMSSFFPAKFGEYRSSDFEVKADYVFPSAYIYILVQPPPFSP